MNADEWAAGNDPRPMVAYLLSIPHDAPRRRVSDRKLRLFACACWRHLWTNPAEQAEAAAVEAWLESGGDRPDRHEHWVNQPDAAYAAGDAAVSMRPNDPRHGAALLREIVGPWRPVTLPRGPDVAVEGKCPTCDGIGWYNEMGPNTFPVTCRHCGGAGVNVTPAPGPCPWLTRDVLALAHAAHDERRADGTLDPVRLAVLADCLEEAGCVGETCPACRGVNEARSNRVPPDARRPLDLPRYWCGRCDEQTHRLPHPILAHLRSPGPHVRGCWALDLILNRE